MRSQRGTTLTELVVTSVLLGVIALITIPRSLAAVDNGRVQMASLKAYELQRGMEVYQAFNGKYPEAVSGLPALAKLLDVVGIEQAVLADQDLYAVRDGGAGYVIRIRARDNKGTRIVITDSAVLVEGRQAR